jgi:Phosphodiester glycosidase
VLRIRRTKGRPGGRLGRRVAIGAGVLVLALAAWIVVPAAVAPGNDSFGARVAESARDRGLGFLVTAAEDLQYKLSPPREGGTLDPAARRALAADAPASPKASASPSRDPGVTLQPAMQPLVTPALPGEGAFTGQVTVKGQPAVQVALLRPDAVHTSYLAGIAWMSSKLLRFVQHPGVTDPGQLSRWSQPAVIPTDQRAGLAATFNSGFKIADSRGAFYADGHSVGTLRTGAASLVVYADGHVNIGAWGTDVGMTPQVRTVRQNLNLLISGGRPTPEVNGDSQTTWGATIGAKAYVWRSGVGVTASGDIVFAAGDALSAGTLAGLLQHAGAVRAMELDINKSWVSFMWYSPASGSPVPHKLVDFSRPADRYYTLNNRDFFAVYAR